MQQQNKPSVMKQNLCYTSSTKPQQQQNEIAGRLVKPMKYSVA